MNILLDKVVSFFCLKLKISITTLRELHIVPEMVIAYSVLKLRSLDGFRLFFEPLFVSSNIEPLEAKASLLKI